jgi:membrane-bound inhibitor of C-type lysozyme
MANVWGAGFKAGEVVTLTAGDAVLASATANASGAFAASGTVNLADGVYTLWAQGDMDSNATAGLLVGLK